MSQVRSFNMHAMLTANCTVILQQFELDAKACRPGGLEHRLCI
jgi:hypothetical protein